MTNIDFAKIRVMLTTEGTYPFHQGGVSTWCDSLINKIDDVDFVLYSVIMNPFVTQKFTLPKHASLIKVPLWGTEEPCEHLATPFSHVYLAKKKTLDPIIKTRFAPLFRDLIREILALEKNPKQFGFILYELYQYFKEFEYKKSFKSEIIWDLYKEELMKAAADSNNRLPQPDVYSMIQSLGWVYRFLNIINTPFPDVHVSHSAAAAFCSLPCVLSKIENKTPFLLTEHGVYIREQYLSLSQRTYSSFLNTFLIRMVQSVSSLSYEFADQVSPVCTYNTRWEKKFGVAPKNIQVIYNGVDKNVFTPDRGSVKNKYPTVVTVARIDPVKDILTLIRSAAIVKESVPDVRYIIYGSVSVPDYYKQCLELREQLGLTEIFIFAGHTTDIPAAYKSGDVIALSSITEAFPYSVVEAMMSAKAIVSTDVGGIREALGDSGILVNPKDPEALAKGITTLLKDTALRTELGSEARERALSSFTIGKNMGLYLKSYIQLAIGTSESQILSPTSIKPAKRQNLLVQRGYALLELGYTHEAITQLQAAIKEYVHSPATPVILMEIANAYNMLGEFDKAFHELEKAELLSGELNRKGQARIA